MDAPAFASSLSTNPDSDAAMEEVVRGVQAGLAGRKPDLAVVFVSHDHGTAIEQLGPRIAAGIGARVVLGCTGEGIVGQSREVERGAAIALFCGALPHTELHHLVLHAVKLDMERDGQSTLSQSV